VPDVHVWGGDGHGGGAAAASHNRRWRGGGQVFELERETDGQPLQVLGWHVICSRGLIDELNLDHIKLINFLREVPPVPCLLALPTAPALVSRAPAS